MLARQSDTNPNFRPAHPRPAVDAGDFDAVFNAIFGSDTAPAQAPALADTVIIRQMADMIVLALGNDRSLDFDDFVRAGLTAAEINTHRHMAMRVANAEMLGRRAATATPAYDRAARLQLARRAIFADCPDRQKAVTLLQVAGLTKTEIDDLLPDAICLAADDLHDQAVK